MKGKALEKAESMVATMSRIHQRNPLSAHDEEQLALMSALVAEVEHCYRLFESLTPSGSEFYHDPERCAEYVRSTLKEQHELILKQQKEIRELRKKS